MKLSSLFVSLLLLCLLIACSQEPQFAESADPKDFDGQWVGTWSWDTNSSSTVEISAGKIKVTRFPIEETNQMSVVSTEGEAEFQKEWSRRSPCVLVVFSKPNKGVPLYITKDKEHLVYEADIVRDQRIIFKKTHQSDKASTEQGKQSQ